MEGERVIVINIRSEVIYMKKIRFTDAENFYFDEQRHGVVKDGKLETLTPQHFKILQILVNNQGCIISGKDLLEKMKVDENDIYEYNNLNTEISRLRDVIQKISGTRDIIRNERGVGYWVNIESKEYMIDEQKKNLYIPLINTYYRKYRNISLKKFTQKNYGLSEDIRLTEVYGYPTIEPIDDNEREWGLREYDETGKYLMQAPAGFGKSTLMKSILLSIISQDIEELNTVLKKENLTEKEKVREERKAKELASYQKLREFHNIQKEYFPIMLETVKMNFEKISENSSEEEIFDFLYETGEFSGYFDNDNVDDEGKVKDTKVQWREFLEHCNQKKQLLFLIDGYDEISAAQRIKCGIFLDKLGNSSFGSKATIIVASRPMESGDSLAGYRSYKIVSTDINRDEEFVVGLIKKYVHFSKIDVDIVELVEEMKNNEFLCKLVVGPYMIVLVALSMVDNRVFGGKKYIINTNRVVNDLIESLATRHRDIYENMHHNPKEIRPLLEMYEEFAYEMLCNVTRGELGIVDLNNRFAKTAIETAQSVKERYKKLYPHTEFLYFESSNAEIADLLFTGLGLMEKTEGMITFVAPEVITVELGARWLLRSLVRAENTEWEKNQSNISEQEEMSQSEALKNFITNAEQIDKYYRYDVFVVMITWLSDQKGLKTIETWDLNTDDMSMYCEDILLKIVDYFIENYSHDTEEINRAIKKLLKEKYGSNFLINCKDRDYQADMQAARERLQELVGEE